MQGGDPEISFREFNAQKDSGDVAALFNTLYPSRPVDHRYPVWRYTEGPLPGGALVATANGVIVGSCAFRVEPFAFGPRGRILGLHGLDFMVHPTWQRKRIGSGLAVRLRDYASRYGANFIYMLTNVKGARVLTERLGWTRLSTIATYRCAALPISPGEMNQARISVRHHSGVDSALCSSLFARQFNPGDSDVVPVRSTEILDWRYRNDPRNQYHMATIALDGRLSGYLIFKWFHRDEHPAEIDILDYVAAVDTPVTFVVRELRSLLKVNASANLWLDGVFTRGDHDSPSGLEPTGYTSTLVIERTDPDCPGFVSIAMPLGWHEAF